MRRRLTMDKAGLGGLVRVGLGGLVREHRGLWLCVCVVSARVCSPFCRVVSVILSTPRPCSAFKSL